MPPASQNRQNQKRQSQKRERQKQGRAARQAAVLRARQRRSRRIRIIVAGFLAVVVILSIVTLVSGGKKTKKVSTTSPTTAATPASLPKPAAGASIEGTTSCPKPDGSSPRTTHFAKPPPNCIDPARTYTAEINTTMGTITANLDMKAAPVTVNNFVVLARYHFYDGISFHRVVPNFVIQVGDPEETGMGDAGYKFEDELPQPGQYKLGSVAMANSGPNTNGSQFFIVSGDNGLQLPPNYSLFGQVTGDGMDVVKKIDATGIAGSPNGVPSAVVTIESVTVKES